MTRNTSEDYNEEMGFVRKFFLVILILLLPILLFGLALDFGILHVVGSPTPVKQLLVASGIYSNAVNNALQQAQNSADTNNEISLTDPAIESAANSVFTPQLVQQSAEQAVDGIYDWLNGLTPQPDFNIDLSAQKSAFAQKVGLVAQSRATSLPLCTSVPASVDPLSVTCLPPGVTPAQVGQQTKDDVLNAQGFLENPVLSADTIKSQGSKQSVFESRGLKQLPTQYQRAKKAPPILIALTVLVVVGIVFLSASLRRGWRRSGVILLVTGVLLLVFAWGLNTVVNHNAVPKIQLDNKALQKDVQKLAEGLSGKVDRDYGIFGGIYAGLGLLIIAGTMFIGRGVRKALTAPPASGAAAAPTRLALKTSPRPKRPSKIQG